MPTTAPTSDSEEKPKSFGDKRFVCKLEKD